MRQYNDITEIAPALATWVLTLFNILLQIINHVHLHTPN